MHQFGDSDFVARLKYIKFGGRERPVYSGYRPLIEFEGISEMRTSGQQTFIDTTEVRPGERVVAEISIIAQEFMQSRLFVGQRFIFCEGSTKIGFGEIVDILHKPLLSKTTHTYWDDFNAFVQQTRAYSNFPPERLLKQWQVTVSDLIEQVSWDNAFEMYNDLIVRAKIQAVLDDEQQQTQSFFPDFVKRLQQVDLIFESFLNQHQSA